MNEPWSLILFMSFLLCQAKNAESQHHEPITGERKRTTTTSIPPSIHCGSIFTSTTVDRWDLFDIPGILDGNDFAFNLSVASSVSMEFSTCFKSTNFDTIVGVFDPITEHWIDFNDDAPSCGSKSLLSTVLGPVSCVLFLCAPHMIYFRGIML